MVIALLKWVSKNISRLEIPNDFSQVKLYIENTSLHIYRPLKNATGIFCKRRNEMTLGVEWGWMYAPNHSFFFPFFFEDERLLHSRCFQ